jgi:hypothetical protein
VNNAPIHNEYVNIINILHTKVSIKAGDVLEFP